MKKGRFAMKPWTPPPETDHPLLPPPPPRHRPHDRPPHVVLTEGIAYVSEQVEEVKRAVAELRELIEARKQ
jgi:hypothetical protein